MVSGPEVAHLISQFDSILDRGQGSAVLHHEQTSSVQSTFIKQVKAVVTAFEDRGNPFSPEGIDLYAMI